MMKIIFTTKKIEEFKALASNQNLTDAQRASRLGLKNSTSYRFTCKQLEARGHVITNSNQVVLMAIKEFVKNGLSPAQISAKLSMGEQEILDILSAEKMRIEKENITVEGRIKMRHAKIQQSTINSIVFYHALAGNKPLSEASK